MPTNFTTIVFQSWLKILSVQKNRPTKAQASALTHLMANSLLAGGAGFSLDTAGRYTLCRPPAHETGLTPKMRL